MHIFTTAGFERKAILNALDKSQAIIHFQPDGTILWANENFLGAVGYMLDEIKGKHHSMFVEPAYASSTDYKNFWTSLKDGQFQAAEYKRTPRVTGKSGFRPRTTQ